LLEKSLDRLKKNDKLPKEYQTKSLPTHPHYLCESCITTKYAFGVIDKYIWKIEIEEEISKMNFSLKNSDEMIEDYDEDWYLDNDIKINKETKEINEKYERLKIRRGLDSYVDTIRALFQEVILMKKN
jgi:hypothetical protein